MIFLSLVRTDTNDLFPETLTTATDAFFFFSTLLEKLQVPQGNQEPDTPPPFSPSFGKAAACTGGNGAQACVVFCPKRHSWVQPICWRRLQMQTEHPPLPARWFVPSLWLCPALLPCSPGAEQHCQGDKGLRLGAAIPCSCGLAENYCSAGEENNILFTVSPGTRLRAEQVLTHRLRRGAEMQTPAASCELSSALAEPHTSPCTCTGSGTHTGSALPPGCPHGPGRDLLPPATSGSRGQFVAVPPQAAGTGLAQQTPSRSRGAWPGVAGTDEGPSHTSTPRSCQESQEF